MTPTADSWHRLASLLLCSSGWVALLLLGCGGRTEALDPSTLPDKPNIVVLLADDLGWNDVGYHGGAIATPHIDALAREGLRLGRLYATPICAPSRASLLTGQLPWRVGLVENPPPQGEGGLDLAQETLADHLRAAGYRTALVGKWHLGHARPEQRPLARGFDHFYGHLYGFIDYYTHRRDEVLDWQRNGEAVVEHGYTTRLLAREANRLLREHDGRSPLFLFVSFNAPHTPLQLAPKRRLEGETAEERNRACFAGMVEELDDAIGSILATLDERGLRDDTLVLFASDNGGSPYHGASNAPLRGGKYEVYEGALRVPAVLRWPGRFPAGERSEQVLALHDLGRMLATAAGVDMGAVDGIDFLSELREGRTREREDLLFSLRRPYGWRHALKRGRWKLIRETSFEDGTVRDELYDIQADPNETRDLALGRAELSSDLGAALEAHIQSLPDGG